MSFLPIKTGGILGGNNLFEKIIGGTLGAIYGAKNGNALDGILAGYYGMSNPDGLYEKLTNRLFNPKPQPMQPQQQERVM